MYRNWVHAIPKPRVSLAHTHTHIQRKSQQQSTVHSAGDNSNNHNAQQKKAFCARFGYTYHLFGMSVAASYSVPVAPLLSSPASQVDTVRNLAELVEQISPRRVEPAQIGPTPARNWPEPAHIRTKPPHVWCNPAQLWSNPAQIWSNSAKFGSTPPSSWSRPMWDEIAIWLSSLASRGVSLGGRASESL